MKDKKLYSLHEAIKSSYKTEPLRIDLAERVADQVFVKGKNSSVTLDKGLYVFVAALIAGAIIYCLSFFRGFFSFPLLLLLVPMIAYFGLSAKEFMTMSKNIELMAQSSK
jgi:hypothetical protein